MYPGHFFPHLGPGGFGFWHGLLGLFWFGLPLLIVLLLLGLLLWRFGHAFFDGGRQRIQTRAAPIAGGGAGPSAPSAVEILRQRYARGEIDGDTFQVMLNQLRASGSATGPGAGPAGGDEGGQWRNV